MEKMPLAMACNSMIDDTDKKELRQEIKHWWQAVAEHLDKVVGLLFLFLVVVFESPGRRQSLATK